MTIYCKIDYSGWTDTCSTTLSPYSTYTGTSDATTIGINNNNYKNIDYKISNDWTDVTSVSDTWPNYINTGNSYYTNTTTATTYTYYNPWKSSGIGPVLTPGQRIRQMIRDRMAPAIHRSRNRSSLSIAMDVREERARQTLRRIIGEQAFRKFIRDGFITVVPKSGLTYRIYPGHDITEVYDRGIMVDRLCVVLSGGFTPTDSLLMRYLLILNDEGEFSKYAVKHSVIEPRVPLQLPKPRLLADVWNEMKAVA
jgi:hypothetical protein